MYAPFGGGILPQRGFHELRSGFIRAGSLAPIASELMQRTFSRSSICATFSRSVIISSQGGWISVGIIGFLRVTRTPYLNDRPDRVGMRGRPICNSAQDF
mgnify:CR=1 FL=1